MKCLKKHEWNLVLLAAALAFGCGVVGTHQQLQAIGKGADWPDLVCFTRRLYLFRYGPQWAEAELNLNRCLGGCRKSAALMVASTYRRLNSGYCSNMSRGTTSANFTMLQTRLYAPS